MHTALRLLFTAQLYIIFTAATFAHPGPHSHLGAPEGAGHDFIGWEFTLAVVGIIATWLLIRRLRNTRTQ